MDGNKATSVPAGRAVARRPLGGESGASESRHSRPLRLAYFLISFTVGNAGAGYAPSCATALAQ
jgi:hypothetical protein